MGQNNPYGPRGSRVNPLWPQCGSVISNHYAPSENRDPMPTELPIGIIISVYSNIALMAKLYLVNDINVNACGLASVSENA